MYSCLVWKAAKKVTFKWFWTGSTYIFTVLLIEDSAQTPMFSVNEKYVCAFPTARWRTVQLLALEHLHKGNTKLWYKITYCREKFNLKYKLCTALRIPKRISLKGLKFSLNQNSLLRKGLIKWCEKPVKIILELLCFLILIFYFPVLCYRPVLHPSNILDCQFNVFGTIPLVILAGKYPLIYTCPLWMVSWAICK